MRSTGVPLDRIIAVYSTAQLQQFSTVIRPFYVDLIFLINSVINRILDCKIMSKCFISFKTLALSYFNIFSHLKKAILEFPRISSLLINIETYKYKIMLLKLDLAFSERVYKNIFITTNGGLVTFLQNLFSERVISQ